MKPRGDQPKAIDELVKGVEEGNKFQVLLGVTGSGKSFTMANIIYRLQKPAIIIAPNKTLSGQLYTEFKTFFPNNAVEYFVSYYDYYQPEAYLPEYDLYIEKETVINEEVDMMRHSTTRSLVSRKDVIVIATVSCIYNIGSPEVYAGMKLELDEGMNVNFQSLLKKLVALGYTRNDYEFSRSNFRVKGDTIDIFPPYEEEHALRVELFGDVIDSILKLDVRDLRPVEKLKKVEILPGNHFVVQELGQALLGIRKELEERVLELKRMGKEAEAERLKTRTLHDLEMLETVGYCKGIENYSRYFDGRKPGEPPFTLLDYFPEDFIMFIDESHITVPQLQGMLKGDRTRKEALVKHGFRLPSAFDNRPLSFEEFSKYMKKVIFVSATPGPYELEVTEKVVEQIIRPTGLIDPKAEVREAKGQVKDAVNEVEKVIKRGERALIMTLTKKQAEDLAEHLSSLGVKSRYLHSEIETLERMDILRDLRLGIFDVLVGINLLREGLDLPEVSLVVVFDADREGFLRSERSLIQLAGRAARNVNGFVILYADRMTDALRKATEEMERRRKIQEEYNKAHGITPESVRKQILSIRESVEEKDYFTVPAEEIPFSEIPHLIRDLERRMKEASRKLEFEEAAKLRDKIRELKKLYLMLR